MIRGLIPFVALVATLLLAAPATARDREREAAVEALERAEALAKGRGVRSGRELSPALAALAARRSDLGRFERREADALLARPTENPDPTVPPNLGLQPYQSATTSDDTDHFRVHWVESTSDNDAPPGANNNTSDTPAYITGLKAALEKAFEVENGALGWRTPVSDGTRGGNARTDVYVKDIGDKGLFGYAAPDPGQTGRSRFAYMVMDDDYSEFGAADPQDPLEVTAAHEYNHVLQYAYDTFQDTWMFESTATWIEERVFDDVNDYLFYLGPWADRPSQPLTYAGDGAPPSGDDLKIYGSAIWNHWLDSRYGPAVVRQAWAVSQASGGGYAPGAYDRAIRDMGGVPLGGRGREVLELGREAGAYDRAIRDMGGP